MILPDKAKTAKEEARELLLKEEAAVRDRVCEIQKNLSLMLRALGEMAIANPIYAHSKLPSMVFPCAWFSCAKLLLCSSYITVLFTYLKSITSTDLHKLGLGILIA